jgi:hypothetical protein
MQGLTENKKMKIILVFFLCVLQFALIGCKKKEYFLFLDSHMQGNIYIIKAKDLGKSNSFYPDSLGIVYIPEKIFNSGGRLFLMVDNVRQNEGEFIISDGVTSYEGGRLTYKTFHFPFSDTYVDNKKEYWYNGGQVTELSYFLHTDKIDKKRIAY